MPLSWNLWLQGPDYCDTWNIHLQINPVTEIIHLQIDGNSEDNPSTDDKSLPETNTVKRHYNVVQYCKITHMITEIETEYQLDAGFTKDTPYLTLAGELWGVFCEYLWENWMRFNGTVWPKSPMYQRFTKITIIIVCMWNNLSTKQGIIDQLLVMNYAVDDVLR